jgi:hypothetical protein
MRRLLERPVKLQSAKSTPGSLAEMSPIAAGLLMCIASRIDSD